MPKSSNCQRVWKAQNTRVTVTQRRMTRPKQEIASRKTSWSQQSRVIRGTSGRGPRFLAYAENLQTFSRDSAVTDAQLTGRWDSLRRPDSPSSSPTDESCYRDIRTCFKRHRKYLRPAACT